MFSNSRTISNTVPSSSADANSSNNTFVSSACLEKECLKMYPEYSLLLVHQVKGLFLVLPAANICAAFLHLPYLSEHKIIPGK